MAESQTAETDDIEARPATTAELLQNELMKKREREVAKEAREARLADKPLGPEKPKMPVDEQAFYEFADIEEADILEWDDGEMSEVIAIVPSQNTFDPELEPLGDIVHLRVIEEMDDADNWDDSPRVGDQYDIRDHSLGRELSHGRLTVTEAEE